MKARHTLILAAAAGTAATARGQEIMQVSYSWSEVLAGTLTPVPSPNSVVEPGEAALIRINMYATVNGVNAIGQTTTYTPPPPPGIGTIRGIASFAYSLIGDNRAATATGAWNSRAVTPLLSTGSFAGNVLDGGATVDSFGGGQFISPGQTANSTNPISDAFRGVWTPSSYQQRTVNWKAARATNGAPPGEDNQICVQYGTAFTDPSDPTTAYALYVFPVRAANFGSGINIPISSIPTSSVASLWALAAAWCGRRRRSR